MLAHGAGAGMRHPFMEKLAAALAEQGVASLRYEFPYMSGGGKRPDPPAVLEAAVRKAIEHAVAELPDLPIVAGGKSMGGRMTSQLLARRHDLPVKGVAFVGFPLHQPGKPGRARAEHLFDVQQPMLFLQGTRDTLADLTLMKEVTAELGERATLQVIDGADHSFAVLKRSGRTNEQAFEELVKAFFDWARRIVD